MSAYHLSPASPPRLAVLALTLMLAGCATLPGSRDPGLAAASPVTSAPGIAANPLAAVERTAPAQGAATQPLAERARPMLFSGNDTLFRVPPPRTQVSTQGDAVSLRFEQAPVVDVVHAILGDLLKADYSIVQPIAGEISLHTHQPVPRAEMLDMLESLLSAKGIVMVPDANGRYQVGPPEAVRTAVPLPTMLGNLPVGFSAVIVPLRYVGVTEMVDILRPVTAEENIFRVDAARNLLMLAGTRTQIDAWMEIVSTFDVDFLKGMSVGLFPLEHAPVREVDAALRTLFAGADGNAGAAVGMLPGVGGNGGAATGGREAGQAGSARSLQGPLAGLVRFLPIERLNALLIVTPRAHYLEQARLWIERFDRPLETDAEPQLFVYPIQNGSASHLAGLLSGIFGGSDTASSRPADSGVAPGLGSVASGASAGLSGGGMGQGLSGGMSMGLGAAAPSSAGAAPAAAAAPLSIGGIRVIADEHNNALLIYAPRRDYRRIEAALRQLDVAPTQVLIEASIIEVTLADELQYGLQWFFDGRLGGDYNGSGQLTRGDSSSIGAVNPGFSYSITNPLGNLRAVLTALADKNLLNVISSPSLLVQDNYVAQIQVGDQQPVRTSTTVSDSNAQITSSIEYKDTGVLLSVQPSVNAGGLVSMTVSQTLTDVGAAIDVATGQRPFLKREIATRVAVRSGETVVLGGLIRDNSTRARQGLPFLHDVPVLGNLFGSTTISNDRTELLVLITPRVMRNDQDLREVNAELRERMRAIRDFTVRLRPDDLPALIVPDGAPTVPAD